MWCVMLTNNRGAKKIIAARRPDGADEKVCQAKICENRGFVTVNCRYTLTSNGERVIMHDSGNHAFMNPTDSRAQLLTTCK